MTHDRKPNPSDVSDNEWSLVVPYLTLMTEDAPQRDHPLRELFDGLRYVVRYGITWRAMPNDLPPWSAVYQQTQRWLAALCFEAFAQDLRAVLRGGGWAIRPPRLSTAARSGLRQKAAPVPGMAEPSANAVRKCT